MALSSMFPSSRLTNLRIRLLTILSAYQPAVLVTVAVTSVDFPLPWNMIKPGAQRAAGAGVSGPAQTCHVL